MLKRLFFLLVISLLAIVSHAQILTPAKWVLSVSNENPKVGDEIELIFKITIDKNWYLYSSEFPCEDGPTKTTINFKPNAGYQLVGKLQPIKPIEKHDDIFECEVKIFKGTGEFRQKIKVLDTNLKIDGDYDYQVCTDIDGKCIPFNDEFSFNQIKVTGQKKSEEIVIGPGPVTNPSKWTQFVSNETPKVGDEIELIFKVTIDKNWYLYSSEFDCKDEPIKTEINFKPHPSYQLVGNLQAINPITRHDDVFKCDLKFFKETAEFRQKIKVIDANLKIEGERHYLVYSDVESKGIPFNEDFSFGKIKGTGQSTVTNGLFNGPVLDKSILEGEATINKDSFIGYLIFAFILGLTSLITPCVFPMIPMTVTFFLKDNQSRKQGIRKAIFFGLSIILIYTLAGTLFALLLGAEGLNALATHWAPNLFIFAIFIVFALSFFGLFEINAPYQLVNKADQRAEKGGLIGIFFMAATLVLVSFSCTIPIVGNVVVMAAGGEILKPVLAMFSYSLAFAIPFTLFAIFPEWIKSLPKSGGWLNSVKVTLGFLELALCLKFFSIADQAYHWGILDRDINIAMWIVIFGLLGLYFLGKISMPSDSVVERVTVPRLLLTVATFSFVVYLIPGLWGAPLKMLAGYLPPVSTHDFDLVAMTRSQKNTELCEEPKYADFLHLPHGLKGYYDYKQALACAREQKKPLFIDFTGHGCTNCREMEAVVWSDPQVLQRLQNDFVIVALYVDDKTELPESQWFTSKYDGKVKKTLGKQNADLQITNLENNAQPFYILLGADERVLAWPYDYDRDVQKFVDFLDQGKKKYKELYP
jgi:thiol:disulfide interchange protein